MLRAVKIRLYPNKEQKLKLNKVLGCYRFVYNQILALKQKEYNENKKSLGLTDLSKYFHGTLLKDEQYAWLKEQNTKVMKQSIRQMLSSYDKFFKQHNGFPKFKSKKDKQSDRELYIDCNGDYDKLRDMVANSDKVMFEPTDDPKEHPGVRITYKPNYLQRVFL